MSPQNVRARIGARLNGNDEAGFTLVELLVIVLILGIMAAIALPAFFNQQAKSGDAQAKDTVENAQTAMESCGGDHGGDYSSCGIDALQEIDSSIPATDITVDTSTPIGGYTITAIGEGGQAFTAEREASGEVAYVCTLPGEGGCSESSEGAGTGTWHD